MAEIKQNLSTPIQRDPNAIPAIADEANDGKKAIPSELVLKASDNSTFTQVSESNPLPIRLLNDMEYFGKSTDTKPTNVKVGSTFFEIDTTTAYMYDGATWVVI